MKGRRSIRTGSAFASVGTQQAGDSRESTGAGVTCVGNGVRMMIPSGVRGDGAVFIVRI